MDGNVTDGLSRRMKLNDRSFQEKAAAGMLGNLGFELDEAPSGEEGIELIKQTGNGKGPYSIVFIDWQMPGIDGVETGTRILALPHRGNPPHLVMVTAYGREDVLRQAEQADRHELAHRQRQPIHHRRTVRQLHRRHRDFGITDASARR